MYTVDFLGIVYFKFGRDAVALAPDGTAGVNGMPPHYASLFINAENVAEADWWRGSEFEHKRSLPGDHPKSPDTVVFKEFRIPQATEVTFACDPGAVDAASAMNDLAHLTSLDPQFDVEPQGAIARIAIPGGRLDAYAFDSATAVRWTISEHPDRVVISAGNGRGAKRIVLAGNAVEVVFANTPDLLTERAAGGVGGHTHDGPVDESPNGQHHRHLELYGRINKGPNGGEKFKNANIERKGLTELPYGSAFLRTLVATKQYPNANCSPTCC